MWMLVAQTRTREVVMILKQGGADLTTIVIALLLSFIGVLLMDKGYLLYGSAIFLLGGALMVLCLWIDTRHANRARRRERSRR